MARIAGKDKQIAQWLKKIGVDPHMARRVIIDIPCDGPVSLYIEGWGDSRMFEIEPPPELTTDIVMVTPEEMASDNPKIAEAIKLVRGPGASNQSVVTEDWKERTHTDLTENFQGEISPKIAEGIKLIEGFRKKWERPGD